jgi:hypothetical protein
MRKLVLLVCVFTFVQSYGQLTSLPSGGNKRAFVGEQVGLTDITVRYNRPAVKGRDGQIWGKLVYTGYSDLGFGNTKQAPWRAGANESTTITISNDVKIEGQRLPAGTYGLFILYDPSESTIIFSKDATSWGSYYYNEKEDALRVKVKPATQSNSTEWLKYEFVDQTDSSATIQLVWEKLAIPFRIETDVVRDQLAIFRNELRTNKGCNWASWYQAAQWCADRKVNLEEAKLWADSATGISFGGNTQFAPHTTKAQILRLLGREEEAAAVMKAAMPMASMMELHYYGRQLLTQGKTKEALEVFKQNAVKHPKQFTTLVGLTRGYSATGDYKTALKYALQAQPLAPDPLNKQNMEAMVNKLREGKDVN